MVKTYLRKQNGATIVGSLETSVQLLLIKIILTKLYPSMMRPMWFAPASFVMAGEYAQTVSNPCSGLGTIYLQLDVVATCL